MKPEYQLIPDKLEKSFIAKRVYRKSRPLLSQAWHYHPEIEICLTQRSNGKRFVGNNISNYEENDLVMFGSNLPHGFTTPMKCVQVVILFDENFMGTGFFEKPELKNVKTLLSRAKSGLSFKDETIRKAKKIITRIMKKEGLLKMMCFLELLHLLSNAKDVQSVCNEEYSMDFKAIHLNRIKIVYDYIMENYRSDVSVKEVADLINLTEASFFKFIKKHTKKTFTQMINEFRINHATELLITTDKTIAEAGFESGYNNISYFNRKFKEIMHQTPQEFRNLFNGTIREF